jgi:hypothetical protein
VRPWRRVKTGISPVLGVQCVVLRPSSYTWISHPVCCSSVFTRSLVGVCQ